VLVVLQALEELVLLVLFQVVLVAEEVLVDMAVLEVQVERVRQVPIMVKLVLLAVVMLVVVEEEVAVVLELVQGLVVLLVPLVQATVE
jgi:hypothetical protein